MGYVYKYTHKITGKYYIGSHNGKNKNYSGSGVIWQRAKKKYGLDEFIKEILYEGDNHIYEEEFILKELDVKNDPLSYNMKNEALGGTFFEKENGMFGKHHTEEAKYSIAMALRDKKRPEHSILMQGENNPMFGKNDHAFGIVSYAKNRINISNEEYFGIGRAKEISEKIRIGNLGKSKIGTSIANTGGGNPSAKKILIDGVEYHCIKDAMKQLNLSRHKILKICTLVK